MAYLQINMYKQLLFYALFVDNLMKKCIYLAPLIRGPELVHV